MLNVGLEDYNISCVVYETPLIHTNDLFSWNLCICVALKTPQSVMRLVV